MRVIKGNQSLTHSPVAYRFINLHLIDYYRYFYKNLHLICYGTISISGLEAWASGNLQEFGKLITGSGLSSIKNYECGMYSLLFHCLKHNYS